VGFILQARGTVPAMFNSQQNRGYALLQIIDISETLIQELLISVTEPLRFDAALATGYNFYGSSSGSYPSIYCTGTMPTFSEQTKIKILGYFFVNFL
jgi:hypothetical protein